MRQILANTISQSELKFYSDIVSTIKLTPCEFQLPAKSLAYTINEFVPSAAIIPYRHNSLGLYKYTIK